MSTTTRSVLKVAAVVAAVFAAAAAAEPPPDAGRAVQEQRGPALTLPGEQAPVLEFSHPQPRRALGNSSLRVRLQRFEITGNAVFSDSELQALLQDAVGRELNIAGIEELAYRITGYYRKHGYLFARAYLPEQEIRDGTLHIAVLEGRFFKVRIHNASDMPDLMVNFWPGEVIEASSLERGLLLLRDIPGIAVKSTLKPGAEVGTSDLYIDISDGRKLVGSIDIDDYGNHFTGEYRGGATVVLNNPAGLGDQLTLRGSSAGSGLVYGGLFYQVPVGLQGFKLGASYSRVHYALGSDFDYLDASGTADIINAYALYPFVRSRALNLNGQLGFTHKQLRDEIRLFDSVTDKSADSVAATLSGNSRDTLGYGGANSFSVTLAGGHVDFDSADAADFDRATARTAGTYTTLGVNALRSQYLNDNLSLYVAFSGQLASKNLVSSEKFSLGGPYGVRAYPQGEGTGDEGALLTGELRYDLTGGWQISVFADGGYVAINRDAWDSGRNQRALYGYGLGCRWQSRFGFALNASLAWKIGSENVTSGPDRSPRIWVQMVQYL